MKSPLEFDNTDPNAKDTVEAPPRFVQCKFSDRPNSKTYTYRIEPFVDVDLGQYAITRRNMSKVTIVAIDTAAVPGLALDRYDFVDPVPLEGDEATGFYDPEDVIEE